MSTPQNYVLGRGKLYFGQFASGTQNPGGEREFGNCPDFKISVKTSMLDHYSSQGGIKQKDDSITLEVDYGGSINVDNMTPENLALFFLGSNDVLAQSSVTAATETIVDVKGGLTYQVGVSAANPQGLRNLANVVVKVATVTKVLNTDYTLDAALGRITVIAGAGITDLDDLALTYDVAASTRPRVVSGSTPIEGQLRFIASNPKGKNKDAFMPWVKITPNGDYALIGDTWQSVTFDVEVLNKTGLQAIYVDDRAV